MENLEIYDIKSLEDLCLKCIVNNSLILTVFLDQVKFPKTVSEKLLVDLCAKKKFNNTIFPILSPYHLHLESVEIFDIGKEEFYDFRFLSQFNIIQLSLSSIESQDAMQLLNQLNDQTKVILQELTLSNFSADNFHGFNFGTFLQFPRLTCLDISGTLINNQNFAFICENLPDLLSLNISCTQVRDISCVINLQSLTRLYMFFPQNNCEINHLIGHLIRLENLVELDVSINPEEPITDLDDELDDESWDAFLDSKTHPRMQYLNVSGLGHIFTPETLDVYISNHIQLRKMGVACMVEDETDQEYAYLIAKYPHIEIICNHNDDGMCSVLRYYPSRPYYVLTILETIIGHPTEYFIVPRIKVLRAVLKIIRHRRLRIALKNVDESISVVLLKKFATCIINLIIFCLTSLPERLVVKAVNTLIVCSDVPYAKTQTRDNCFKAVANSSILYNVNFDERFAYQPAMKFIKKNIQNDTIALTHTLSIISKTTQNVRANCMPDFNEDVKCLLSICGKNLKCLPGSDTVNEEDRVDKGLLNDEQGLRMLSLGALWNMTDKSFRICFSFVEQNGLRIYKSILQHYEYHSLKHTFYPKCLGLLTNIVQVLPLRMQILTDTDFINLLWRLKDDKRNTFIIEYFICGIFCHLFCERDADWIRLVGQSKSFYSDELRNRLLLWDLSCNSLFVGYHSFQPFQVMIGDSECTESGYLWTLWSVYHSVSILGQEIIPKLKDCPPLMDFIEQKALGPVGDLVSDIAKSISDICKDV